jgi:nitroreductase
MITLRKGSETRKPEHPVDPLFVNRWSPRAMSGEVIPEADLMTLFEAAKWAPSSSNGQPWRILYARRGTPAWDTFFNLLLDFNKMWCANAGALVVWVSKKTLDNGQPGRTHSFDTGSAWMSLALQAFLKGYVAHGMAGLDYERARTELGVPDEFQVEAMCAIGVPGDPAVLHERMRKSENPNDRRPLEKTIAEGKFRF